MDINELLKGINCKCGKRHECSIRSVYIEKNAIARLVDICAQYKNILIVADQNTYKAAGEKVEKTLNGKKLSKVIFDGDNVLVPNEEAILTVEKFLQGVELIIAVGSGVIQDLCKYVSHFNKIPYLDVATAPSMDGYASDGAAMILNGMKETVKAGLPISIIADVDVLCNAPMDMIKAGYGDVIGKYSALNDWKISNIITGEYLCPFIYDLTMEQIQTVVSLADGLLKRNEESIQSLMQALVVIGILMSFAGSSRPASGSEHHLSHFFEITGIVNNRPYLSHGLDVAFSTVVTASVRENLLNTSFKKDIYSQSEKQIEEEITRVYSSVANGCLNLQKKTGYYNNSRAEIYVSKEEEIKNVLREMPSANQIKDLLKKVELDYQDFINFYGEKNILNAVMYAKDLKDRFTVLWLNYDLLKGELYV